MTGGMRGLAVLLASFVYYWALLSDGRFLAAADLHYGLTFNSMIEHLARWEFDVDPAAIRKEGFNRDGRTFAYFGIFPALLRLPILAFPSWRLVDFTILSCALGAALTLAGQLRALVIFRAALGPSAAAGVVTGLTAVALILGGAQVQFLRPSIFQESIFWGGAFAAWFGALLLRWCLHPDRRRPRHLVAMAALAVLCLLARVSTAMGPYLALGAVMLLALLAAVRTGGGRAVAARMAMALRPLLLPALLLTAGIVITGTVNQMRWGTPLTFQDYRYYNMLGGPDHPVHEVIRNHGYFSLWRVPFNLSYYFLPIWTIIAADGHFLFRAAQGRLFFTVEFPPGSFLVSDMYLMFLAVLGVGVLARRGSAGWRPAGWDMATLRLVAPALAVPGLFMLMAIAATFRYRIEFYQLIVFLALFGQVALLRRMQMRPRQWRALGVAMVAASVVAAHAMLLSYKIAPWDDAAPIEAMGWRTAYATYFREAYPGVARWLGGWLAP